MLGNDDVSGSVLCDNRDKSNTKLTALDSTLVLLNVTSPSDAHALLRKSTVGAEFRKIINMKGRRQIWCSDLLFLYWVGKSDANSGGNRPTI